MQTKALDVQAVVRVIATKKFKVLMPSEKFNTVVKLAAGIDYPAHVRDQVCREDVGHQFTEAFLNRLKKDPALKKLVGGIEWKVEVSHVDFEESNPAVVVG